MSQDSAERGKEKREKITPPPARAAVITSRPRRSSVVSSKETLHPVIAPRSLMVARESQHGINGARLDEGASTDDSSRSDLTIRRSR